MCPPGIVALSDGHQTSVYSQYPALDASNWLATVNGTRRLRRLTSWEPVRLQIDAPSMLPAAVFAWVNQPHPHGGFGGKQKWDPGRASMEVTSRRGLRPFQKV